MITYLGMTMPMAIFYYILSSLNTPNLTLSTISIVTSAAGITE